MDDNTKAIVDLRHKFYLVSDNELKCVSSVTNRDDFETIKELTGDIETDDRIPKDVKSGIKEFEHKKQICSHGTKNGGYTCQQCTDYRQRAKHRKKKSQRQARFDLDHAELGFVPKRQYFDSEWDRHLGKAIHGTLSETTFSQRSSGRTIRVSRSVISTFGRVEIHSLK